LIFFFFQHFHLTTDSKDRAGGCNGGRENVLAVGNCCYVAVCSAAQSASAPTWGEEGRAA